MVYEQFYSVDTQPGVLALIDGREPRVAWAMRHIQPDDAVLDVGCYKGEIAIPIAKITGAIVIGVDVAAFAVAQATVAARRLGVRAVFEKAWAENLPYGDDRFDVVLLLEILEHVVEPVVVINEAERVCRPGGTIVISSPVHAEELEELSAGNIPGFEHLRMHVREYDPSVELADKVNLKIGGAVASGGIYFYLASYTVNK